MKVALIWGHRLNKWQAQSFEPLANSLEITNFSTKSHRYDISDIKIPLKVLPGVVSAKFGITHKVKREILRRLIGDYQQMVGLEDALKGYDIAHTTETYHYFTLQAVRAKRKGRVRRVVSTIWENIPFGMEGIWARDKIKKETISYIDHFIATSNKAKDALILEGVEPERISVIMMGVDINKFIPTGKNPELLSQFHLSQDDFVILFIGRMVWEKGCCDLLFAGKKLLDDQELDNKKIKFLFVGDGPERKYLQHLSEQLNITSSVIFRIDVSYKQIAEVHNLADIFVLPSLPTKAWQEQLGLVFVESMACAKPVISSLSGSIPEVISEAGILVQPGDHRSLYQAIKNLILNPGKCKEIGRLARQRVEKMLDSRMVAEKIKAIYEKVLE
jgi:glycosyltransferase involved in cell wall biosynthesis